ncbi:EAL domain-containing protein [Catellatospora sp. NPDC049111]|uniref:EAL domain-containing protein n=1 Tax=Catellatospora sp. NPDC049111 TaxID=3155271 RepID=UPI0033DDF402
MASDDFDAIVAARAVHPVFQPVVSLNDGRPVGFEALARGPDGSRYHSPTALFAEAARRGMTADLDWICGVAACAQALDLGLRHVPLFLNVNPSSLGTACPADLQPTYRRALRELDLVLEITERRGGDPASILHAVAAFRQQGRRIAIDDVGVDPFSLNMISILAPDVIKIDRSITQGIEPSWARTYVLNSVKVEAQATGAALLCEGIETPEHLDAARAMGATLGQGWLFGRPGQLPTTLALSPEPLPRVTPYPDYAATPFAAIRGRAQTLPMSQHMLVPLCALLEDMALHTDAVRILFAAVSKTTPFDDRAWKTYNHIAQRGVGVAVFGREPLAPLGADVHIVPLPDTDPLLDECALIAVGSHFAAAMLARHIEPGRTDGEAQLYDAVLTYDRRIVIEALHALMSRVTSLPPEAPQL